MQNWQPPLISTQEAEQRLLGFLPSITLHQQELHEDFLLELRAVHNIPAP